LGFETDTQLIRIPAKLLRTPILSLIRNGKINWTEKPRGASWNLKQVKFVNAGHIDKLNIWLMPGSRFDNKGQPGTLRDNMVACLINHGFSNVAAGTKGEGGVSDLQYFWTADMPKSRDVKDLAKAQGKKMTLVILEKKDQGVYSRIKRAADLDYGVQVVCAVGVDIPHYQPGEGQQAPGFQNARLSNLALKFNMKSGGHNHVLNSLDLNDLLRKERNSTVIFGADVTHPPVGSVAGHPSIACVVASVDGEFQNYPGSMRLQAGKQEVCIVCLPFVSNQLICVLGDRGHGEHGRRETRSLVQEE
jgi:eukaryotic translation initiation factor 2C